MENLENMLFIFSEHFMGDMYFLCVFKNCSGRAGEKRSVFYQLDAEGVLVNVAKVWILPLHAVPSFGRITKDR